MNKLILITSLLILFLNCKKEDVSKKTTSSQDCIVTVDTSGNLNVDTNNNINSDTTTTTTVVKPEKIKYLALGDSYTIGSGVPVEDRFPEQLVERLKNDEIEYELLDIIATSGWKTTDLQRGIDNQEPPTDYNLVSLLIGVNNQFQQADSSLYPEQFESLLKQAIQFAAGDTAKVFVISIPDYGYTPFGASNKEKIEREINWYNSINKQISLEYGVKYYNITDISRQAEDDNTLLASDQLHPSGKMYSLWIDLFYVDILKIYQ